jgi:hypothetical protein
MASTELSVIDRLIDVARGEAEPEPEDRENRGTRRCPYEGRVALVQIVPDGGKSIPTVVTCKNMSAGGMCVRSKFMLHVGHEGALLVQRSSGEVVMIGARVVHCAYVGNMMHESGIEFIALAEAFAMDDFRDDDGRLPELGMRRAA